MKSFRMADLFTLLLGVRGSSFRKKNAGRNHVFGNPAFQQILYLLFRQNAFRRQLHRGHRHFAVYISWGIPTTAALINPVQPVQLIFNIKAPYFSPAPGLSCPFPVHDKQIPSPLKYPRSPVMEPAVSVQLPGSLLIIPVQENRPLTAISPTWPVCICEPESSSIQKQVPGMGRPEEPM